MKKNLDIRNYLKLNKVKQYELANALSIREDVLSKKLRNELSMNEKEMIFRTIDNLALRGDNIESKHD